MIDSTTKGNIVSELNTLISQIAPAVGAAVSAYGVGVLSQAEDEAASATVRLGQRVLSRILGGATDPAPVRDAVANLAAAAGDPDALASLRWQIGQVLAGDAELRAELAGLLPAPPNVQAVGAHGVAVAGDSSGIVSTGDGATNTQLR